MAKLADSIIGVKLKVEASPFGVTMETGIRRLLLNTVIPDVWIIEEQLRRERERRKKERENIIPLELPVSFPQSEEGPEANKHKKEEIEERVVIIDL